MGPTFSMMAAGLLVAQTANPFALNSGKPCPCQQNAPVGHIQPVAAAPSSPGFFRGLFKGSSEAAAPVEERPTFMARVQGLFGSKKDAATFEPGPATPYQQAMPYQQGVTVSNAGQMAPAPNRMIQRLPAGQPQPSFAQPQPTISQPQPTYNNMAAPPIPLSAAPARILQPVTYPAVPATQIPPAAVAVNPAVSGSVVQTAVAPSRPNRISPELMGKVGHESDYSWITGQLRIENGRYVIHYAAPEVVDAHDGSLVLTTERDLRGFQDGDFVSIRGSIAGATGGRSQYRLTSIDKLPR